MAYPAIIDGIGRQTASIAKVRPKRPKGEPGAYRDTQAMIEATFDSLLRFERLVGRPGIHRPNFTHIVTHTEALARLETMGHGGLARRGHVGHRVHIDNKVPEVGQAEVHDRSEVTLPGILHTGFWEDPKLQALWHESWNRRSNPNGDWIASGHLFKVLYAFCEIAERIQDPSVVERCATILLERYFDADVQGG